MKLAFNNMAQVKRFTELNLGLVATLAGLIDTSIEEADPEQLIVYPNPVSETLSVKGKSIQQLEVFNFVGQRILFQTYGDQEECMIGVGALVPGIYFVRVTQRDGSVSTEKVVIL